MNRFTRSIVFASLAALLVIAGGCDLTSLNDNPNQPTAADPPKLLTNAQINIAIDTWQDYAGGFWVRYAQYWTTNQYTDADRFAYAPSRPGALWEDLYLGLNDLQEIKRINRATPDQASASGPNANQIAIANIMQVWTLSFMTDIWGPIPVANALQGSESGNFSPAYNSGPEVYDAMVDSLTAASNQIQTGAATLSGGDLVFGGDMAKWKKFANSLKLRIAMRASGNGNGFPSGLGGVSEAGGSTEAVVNTWIQEALDAGVFESNDDNALLPFAGSPYQNPFYVNREVDNRSDWAAPEGIVGVMNSSDDPRRSAFFTDADGDASNGNQFVGFPYGLPQGQAQGLFTSGNFSIPSNRVASTPTAPAILMLYDEVEFIKAEILLRNDLDDAGISGTAQSHFENALRASMEYWGVTDQTEQDDFVSAVGAVTSNNFRQKLGTQKWVAQYLQGVQGWSTWRRLDFTGVLQIPQGDPGQERFGKSIAVRMTYPNDEFTLNNANVTDAINNLLGGSGAGDDNQGVLLWWDTEYPSGAY